jgi:hypothetical protein
MTPDGGRGGASLYRGDYSSGGGGGGGYAGGGGGGGGLASGGGGGGGSSDGVGPGLSNEMTATGAASVTITYTVPGLKLAQELVSQTNEVAPGTALADHAYTIHAAVYSEHTDHACADITDYLSLVKALTGTTLTRTQASLLTTDATKLADVLGCT